MRQCALRFVTGVGPGTERAIARRFAAAGYRLAANARSRDRLGDLSTELGGIDVLVGDLADPTARTAVVKQLLAIDAPSVVVNNAVGGTFG